MTHFARSVLLVTIILAPLHMEFSPGRDVVPSSPVGHGADQTVAIIVNQSNPVENYSFDELRKIFLGERSHWPNGRRITLVMLDPAQPERKAILRDIYGMTEKDFNNHFIQGVFTGAVFVSPKTLGSSAEVRRFVFNVPGAIGYVRGSDVDQTVKVLRIDGHTPEDNDYRIKLGGRSGK
jgi:ABC-type phosphate transport system substrate-binding protein